MHYELASFLAENGNLKDKELTGGQRSCGEAGLRMAEDAEAVWTLVTAAQRANRRASRASRVRGLPAW